MGNLLSSTEYHDGCETAGQEGRLGGLPRFTGTASGVSAKSSSLTPKNRPMKSTRSSGVTSGRWSDCSPARASSRFLAACAASFGLRIFFAGMGVLCAINLDRRRSVYTYRNSPSYIGGGRDAAHAKRRMRRLINDTIVSFASCCTNSQGNCDTLCTGSTSGGSRARIATDVLIRVSCVLVSKRYRQIFSHIPLTATEQPCYHEA